jgi:UDP-2,4-diacetamido-2,4,6-trideoxy-beta-L-altropyranose hydrolase
MAAADSQCVVFRVDASLHIGTGHLMRCLSLAAALSQRGARCHFVGRSWGGLAGLVQAQGHPVLTLPPSVPQRARESARSPQADDPPHAHWLDGDWQADAAQTLHLLGELDADWLVVDHYALAAPWERAVRTATRQLMVIDDLADRGHACDLLLDFNAYADAQQRYRPHVGNNTRCLLGPGYALLRAEFALARSAQPRFPHRDALFVGFGGADADNLSLRSLYAARALCRAGVPCDVVVGATYPFLEQLRRELEAPDFRTVRLHVASNQVAQLMARARLAVCGGGVSTWERLCLGLPALVVATADNQVPALSHLHAQGLIHLLGRAEDVGPERLEQELHRIWGQPDALAAMGQRAAGLVDGAGADRVVDEMLLRTVPAPVGAPTVPPEAAAPVFLAPLGSGHVPRLTAWKNDPAIAHQIAAHPARFSEADVLAWLERNAADPNQVFLGIFERHGGTVVGVARLMFIDWVSGVAELGIFIGDADARGRGQGRAAVAQLLQRAFDQLGLQRVFLKVMADNTAALRCYQACRFTHEGRLRSHFLSRGVHHDMLVMGILQAERAAALTSL